MTVMKKIATYLLPLLAALLVACNSSSRKQIGGDNPTDVLSDWVIEDESGHLLAEADNNILEIISPEGLTLWYKQRLTGEYRISYRICMVAEGNRFDRLSDMNCFWGASDPEHPDNFFARSDWRNGEFHKYNSLNLFYVGFGGNDNTTTRFRQYHGTYYGIDDSKVKPLLQEYTDERHLLKPDKWYRVDITVGNHETAYSIDGETLFRLPVQQGTCDGYFGLRLLTNHILLTDFNVEKRR